MTFLLLTENKIFKLLLFVKFVYVPLRINASVIAKAKLALVFSIKTGMVESVAVL